MLPVIKTQPGVEVSAVARFAFLAKRVMEMKQAKISAAPVCTLPFVIAFVFVEKKSAF